MFYLNKIETLCREQNIPLLLLNVPCAKSWNYAKHNTVAAYAKEHGLPYLDLNLGHETIGFDWLSNTSDKGGHVNFAGAQKVTAFIGKYISDNYSMPNHRGEALYNDWNNDLEIYRNMLKYY